MRSLARLSATISAVLLLGIGISRGLGGEWGMAVPFILGAIGFVILAWPRTRPAGEDSTPPDKETPEP